ncbi:glycosyltransferase family 2 protein [Microbacterium sp. SD291]|uniref:glycosyltransferase family 2 protein n=1 Tax=Microbacterium sp. SD291 TaxID=2782007 RepID=UPI001A958310|nr:glycosyltransferase family 2 protein [Microbacterium sp. SD291]MBO0981009.1 glycosyltransferase family 2 protein [Microbacterium sp. SD291]
MTGERPVGGEGVGTPGAARIEAISVVIPHYGDPAHAQALIARLRDQTDAPEIQVIVVDDASPQPFPEVDEVEVVRRAVNGGFGAAVNSGARAARHPHLLILNSDLLVEPDFLAKLRREAQPWQPAVCAPMLLGHDGATQWGGRHFPRHRHHIIEWLTPLARFRTRLHEAVGHDTRCVEGAVVPVDWLVGAALLVPTAEFTAVGGFDEGYFMNSEEVDLQRRLRERRIPSIFLGTVVVHHEGGGSSDSARRVRWVTQSRLRYAAKWGEHPGLLRAGLTGASIVNLVANALRRAARRDVRPLQIFRRELAAIAHVDIEER